MRRSHPAISIALLLLLALAGLPGCARLNDRNRPWALFESPEGRFRVLTPTPLSYATEQVGGEEVSVNMHRYTSQPSPSEEYSVIHYDLKMVGLPITLDEEQRELLFDANKSTAIAQARGTLESERPLQLARFRGREYVVGNRSDDRRMFTRLYLVLDRVYLLVALQPQKEESRERVDHFFNSFELSEQIVQ